ncbi:MAG: hypothetical protein ACREOU_07270 [Candidatus Eiseniibacteriota bacterium]
MKRSSSESIGRLLLASLLASPFAGLPLAATGCADRSEPHFFAAEGGPKLHLPGPMRGALRTHDAAFQVFERHDYSSRIFESGEWRYELSAKQVPFAILGDFDGDGRIDAALHGHSGDSVICIVAVLADSTTPRVMEISRHPGPGRGPRERLGDFLMHVPAGRVPVAWTEAETTIVLAHEAFEHVIFEKTAVMHYYEGGRFQNIVTSD